MTRPNIFGETQYYSIDETRIVEMLLVHGWRFDVAAGWREQAEGEARAALERIYVKWAHFHRAERIWEDHCVRAARRQVWETVGDNELGPAPDAGCASPTTLYGPEKPLFDKTWKLPDIEKLAAQ